MASSFHVKEHRVEAQHIREYPKATAHSQDEVLHLAVKQYIPKSNPNPQPGDVTVIGAHANGFPKVSGPYICVDMPNLLIPLVGTIRAFMGRPRRRTSQARRPRARHMDRRRGLARPERHRKRRQDR